MSHIIPRFVSNWLKKTGSPFLIDASQPGFRRQDAPKIPLLCATCEDAISTWESTFARTVFHPYTTDKLSASLSYSHWLISFARSLSWRALANAEYMGELDLYSGGPEALDCWGRVMLGHLPEAADNREHHLFIYGAPEEVPPEAAGVHAYIERSYGVAIRFELGLVVIRLPGMAICSTIRSGDHLQAHGTRLTLDGIYVASDTRMNDTRFYQIMTEQFSKLRETSLPQSRRAKIAKWRKTNADQWVNSKSWQAFQKDLDLLQRQVDPESPDNDNLSS